LSFSFSVVLFAALFFTFCNSAPFTEETELKAKDANSNPVSSEGTEDGSNEADFSEQAEKVKPRDEEEAAEIEGKTYLAEDEEITLAEKNDPAAGNDWNDENDGDFESEATMELKDEALAAKSEEMADWAEDDGDNIGDDEDDAAEEDDDDDDGIDFPEDPAMELRDDAGTDGAEETNDVVEDEDLDEEEDENDELKGFNELEVEDPQRRRRPSSRGGRGRKNRGGRRRWPGSRGGRRRKNRGGLRRPGPRNGRNNKGRKKTSGRRGRNSGGRRGRSRNRGIGGGRNSKGRRRGSRQRGQICGGQVIADPDRYMCCQGNIVRRRGGRRAKCCGVVSYDPDRGLCCNGAFQYKPGPDYKCCGRVSYNSRITKCCNGRVIPKSQACR